MGGMCSGGTMKKRSSSEEEYRERSSGFSGKLKSLNSFSKQTGDNSYEEYPPEVEFFEKKMHHPFDSGELRLSISNEFKPSTPVRTIANKQSQTSSFLGKAGIAGLEKAVDVLDTLGSSMSNLNVSSGFGSNMASRGNKIFILAFEVANTIAKGANLLQSLSKENIQFLKKEILRSEGVQQLVSTDTNELLSIAASDKREEFNVFSQEVVRFGDLCKDPQWHNLGRFFSRLDSEPATHKQLREEAEMTMHEFTNLAQHTSELYHELNTLDRFVQDYRRKLEEVDSLHLPRKGESLTILHGEVKNQRKLVRGLKKKSLWSKSLEEVVEKLVDIVTFIHQEILEAFGVNGEAFTFGGKESTNKPERLGVAGLALHYANIITQIDNVASRPTSLLPNTRDTLYNGLPNSVKTALRSRLQTADVKEVLTIPQIKAEMEKTLQWLVPIATDTTKAHQGFGWVGEWANTGNEFGKKTATQNNIIRLQTLYHADKQKTDQCILELVTCLHRLISRVRFGDNGSRSSLPIRSPTRKGLMLHTDTRDNFRTHGVQISHEDKILLEEVMKRGRLVRRDRSKSQEFVMMGKKRRKKVWALSRSTGSSPRREELGHQNSCLLDVLDGLDSTYSKEG
ncbi:hypothetical protein LguiA_003642 [Lonicera macranthoides]